MAQKFRITYATLSADNEDLQRNYDEAAERMRAELGKEYPVVINGEERWREDRYNEPSPIDGTLTIGSFSQATVEDVEDAVKAAKAFSLEWDRIGWQERVRILRDVADVMEERLFDLAALMAFEVGKSRLEALGDVQETAELIRWNCDEVEKHEGFRTPMSGLGAAGDYYDVMRPYGVWAVISPFNFPMALSGGPSSGALVAGNCVVLKPSNQGALLGYKLYECYRDGGVPPGAFHLVVGRGVVAGEALWKHPDVGGITFTGSYNVGMDIYKNFAVNVPKPVICEMGGKNPTIVTKNADLDKATDGVMRSAFGFGGQKCSACSRVFVEREVYDDFVGQLKTKAEKIKVGNPIERDVYLGPIINEAALDTFEEAAEEARKNGTIVTGGQRITEGELGKGLFVEPTVVEVPDDSWIWKRELFVPFVAVAPFDELDAAIDKANETEYGLTAGFFSEEQSEIDEWLDRIQAGVVYVNRRAGSTTGAWPGVQPFGGWKGSGTTGKAGGGPYYVMQYLREQSRTVISRVSVGESQLTYDGLAAFNGPKLITDVPGTEAMAWVERDRRVTSPSLPRAYPFVPKRGAGSVVEDVDGNIFLDLNAGIAVTSTGHCHPRVVEAVQRQATELLHYSASDFFLPVYAEVCERLDQIAPFGGRPARSFLTNSGTEAVEAAIKLARFATGRQYLIGMFQSFHGRSMGSVTLTASKAKYRTNFGPMLPSVYHTFYGDFEYLEEVLFQRLVSPTEVAAIVVESWLGEGGYVLPPDGWFTYVRELCDRHGILLVCDEVQSGMGRSGKMWAIEHEGVEPDIVISGKGIASGLPLGAMIAREDLMIWDLGAHGSTYGGSPLSCAAALATFDVIRDEDLLANADRVGTVLLDGLRGIQQRHPLIREVRGKALWIGLAFADHDVAGAVEIAAFRRGLLMLSCGDDAIRISPSLVFREDQALEALRIFEEVVAEVESGA